MTIRIFLSMLVAGLFLSFASVSGVSALNSDDFVTAPSIKKQRYIKKRVKRKTVKNHKIRKTSKKRTSLRLEKTSRLRAKKRVIRYKRNGKKVTRASLSLNSIKNARHAKLTSRGRMSVAKDTRRKTVRSFGSRVSYKYRPGTVVLSNYTRRLYYVVRPGKVITYPIATPRPDEVWSGSTKITKKKLNPDWYPTPAMREKNPDLPEKVAGGSSANPFGKRALYLGSSLYRIHGTNRPGSIGKSASGGCYRMRNGDIAKLWRMVRSGTPVVVLTRKKI
ncbi:MAG: L,D-transpeptidase [bacterium]|nr:L,D-transpeptidase [bacterium]